MENKKPGEVSKFNNKILGIILARGGSKGIKQKNIVKLCGKPLIAWTINSALKSKKLTDVILSTDSTKIAKIGKKFGVEVPFIRPLKYAKDKSSSVEAIEHAIKWLKQRKKNYKFVTLLEPTSPLRDHKDIDQAILKIIKSRADSLVSVSKAETLNPAYLYKKSKSGKLIPFRHNKKKYIRRQDIDPFYFLDGSVYISKVSTLLKKKTFCHTNTLMYVVPKWKSIEIDDNLDLILARAIMQNKRKI